MGFVINTPQGDVAFSIALGVLLLSVVLQPIVQGCFHRIRANRAWRLLQKNQAVDVTRYGFFSEALGDRGKWDAARIVAIMLAVFHVSTWGLELSLELAVITDGPVDLLNRPPPVISSSDVGDIMFNSDWIVIKNQEPVVDKGVMGNFIGTLADGYVTASYRIRDTFIHGSTVSASWSTDSSGSPSKLFYDEGEGKAKTKGTECSALLRYGDIYVQSEAGSREMWGTVTECESGPKVGNASMSGIETVPTILLNGTKVQEVYLIVEEESSYPSFLYSVWEPVGANTPDEAELHHLFHVSTTTRMVEAVVSGIVNGFVTGGGCVDMVAQFSISHQTYNLAGKARISPFGEQPRASSVARLDDVEAIVAGVEVSALGMICAILLIAVTGVAFVGCLFSLSRRPLDVYDRDALIRAVSLPRRVGADSLLEAPKIFVRPKDGDELGVIVTDKGVKNRCGSLRRRFSQVRGALSCVDEDAIPTGDISRSWSLPSASTSGTTLGHSNWLVQRSSTRVQPQDCINGSYCPVAKTAELVISPMPQFSRQSSSMKILTVKVLLDSPAPKRAPKNQLAVELNSPAMSVSTKSLHPDNIFEEAVAKPNGEKSPRHVDLEENEKKKSNEDLAKEDMAGRLEYRGAADIQTPMGVRNYSSRPYCFAATPKKQ